MEECYFKKSYRVQPVSLLHQCFSRFLNCTNGAKSRKASHMSSKLAVLISAEPIAVANMELFSYFLIQKKLILFIYLLIKRQGR